VLSLHAIAGGATLRGVLQTASAATVVTTIVLSAVVSGTFVALVVLFGERNRAALMKLIDAAPAVTIALLTTAMAGVVWDLADHAEILGTGATTTTLFGSILALFVGISAAAAHHLSRRPAAASQSAPLVAIRRGR
jgi:hypothetical protein